MLSFWACTCRGAVQMASGRCAEQAHSLVEDVRVACAAERGVSSRAIARLGRAACPPHAALGGVEMWCARRGAQSSNAVADPSLTTADRQLVRWRWALERALPVSTCASIRRRRLPSPACQCRAKCAIRSCSAVAPRRRARSVTAECRRGLAAAHWARARKCGGRVESSRARRKVAAGSPR